MKMHLFVITKLEFLLVVVLILFFFTISSACKKPDVFRLDRANIDSIKNKMEDEDGPGVFP